MGNFISKALKPKRQYKFYFLNYLKKIFISYVYHKYEYIKRFIAWGRLGANCYDWDSHNLINIIEFKLKRTEKALLNGHAIHEEKHLKALRIALKLCNLITQDRVSDCLYRRHEAKWGKSEYWLTPDTNKELFSYHHYRPKAVFEKDKKQERKELLEMFNKIDCLEKRNEKLLFKIVQMYYHTWWD